MEAEGDRKVAECGKGRRKRTESCRGWRQRRDRKVAECGKGRRKRTESCRGWRQRGTER